MKTLPAMIAAALLICSSCQISERHPDPVLPLSPRLNPGVIITTPEGAYIIDLLWLKTDQPLPPSPSTD